MLLLRLGSALSVLTVIIAVGVEVADSSTNTTKYYDGYKVYCIDTNGQDSNVRKSLQNFKYDEWNHDLTSIDINISPDQDRSFHKLGLRTRVLHHDLGKPIKAESASMPKWKRHGNDSTNDNSWFTNYQNYEDHLGYFENLQASLPNNSMMMTTGNSSEGRDIFDLHVYGPQGPGVMPAIIYHGTAHAREWISAPVDEFLARQIVNSTREGNAEITDLLTRYEFYFFPVVNPDGFVYSQTTDRMWRKNRQPALTQLTGVSAECIGIDINRNWSFQWNQNPFGVPSDPCAENYQGQNSSEATEIQGLDEFVRRIAGSQGIHLYVDYHAYGQMILFPFGYNQTIYPPELGMWTRAASSLSQNIREADQTRNASTTFIFGPSGASLIELPDQGEFGFLLPSERILPVAMEQWVGQVSLWRMLDEIFFDGHGVSHVH